ncbi:MAG: hypothetical protein ACUZ8H_01425 [Candidatus Anammoxibacter sp.]
MAIEYNQQGNCTTNYLGTALDACVALYGDLVGIDLYTRGSFSLVLASGTFPDLAAYKLLIQGQTLFPLNDLFDFEQNTPENEVANSSRGIKKEIRAGKPEFSLTWSNGGCWHETIFGKKGQNIWDIAFKFEAGILYAKSSDLLNLKPFKMGMFSPETFKVQQGTDPDMTKVLMQLPSAIEWNQRKSFHTWVDIGYDQNDVEGVHNAGIVLDAIPPGTDFSLQVKSLCNTDVLIAGLDDVNEWLINGVQATATTISTVTFNAVTNKYDFVVTPTLIATDTIQPSLADVGATLDVAVNAAGDFYKGKSNLIVVT